MAHRGHIIGLGETEAAPGEPATPDLDTSEWGTKRVTFGGTFFVECPAEEARLALEEAGLAPDEASRASEESGKDRPPYVGYLACAVYSGDGPPKHSRGRGSRGSRGRDSNDDLCERSSPAQAKPCKEPAQKKPRGNTGFKQEEGRSPNSTTAH